MLNTVRKTKTFRFNGSKNDYDRSSQKHTKLYTLESVIDHTINKFLKDNEYILVDIKIITIDTKYHNNGGYNDIDLLYTIIYE